VPLSSTQHPNCEMPGEHAHVNGPTSVGPEPRAPQVKFLCDLQRSQERYVVILGATKICTAAHVYCNTADRTPQKHSGATAAPQNTKGRNTTVLCPTCRPKIEKTTTQTSILLHLRSNFCILLILMERSVNGYLMKFIFGAATKHTRNHRHPYRRSTQLHANTNTPTSTMSCALATNTTVSQKTMCALKRMQSGLSKALTPVHCMKGNCNVPTAPL
jgi:hypothetical protein